MIISRTPVRIPLGGGGTDLPAYYEQHEGSVLTTAVNRYVYIVVKEHFEPTLRFTGYYHKEVARSPEEIKHPVVREVLRMLKITQGVEVVSLSDVPANVGLGTSSSFTVGLLNALHAFKGEHPTPSVLAQEALTVERLILKEPGGVQDQYIAAFGGVISLDISRQGLVTVSPLQMDADLIAELERRLVFFYTKLQRSACQIQEDHVQAIATGTDGVVESLHEIKRIGQDTRAAFGRHDLDTFGQLLDEHWQHKKQLSRNISNDQIDRWYQMAREAGALGGKLVGAGGGGFLMFYCQPDVRDRVRGVLSREELKEIRLRFESTGSRILLHI